MKFLVLALCVCAASAASFVPYGQKPFTPFQQTVAKAFVQTSSPGFVAPPVAYSAARIVTETPVVVTKTVVTANSDAAAKVLRADTDVRHDGFNFFYENDNGIAAQASGITKKVGNDDVLAIQGSYKYRGDDGKEVIVSYIADENGYQPSSDVLPVGPAIPEAILKALEYIRANYKPETSVKAI